MTSENESSRRRFLTTGIAAAGIAAAGCLRLDGAGDGNATAADDHDGTETATESDGTSSVPSDGPLTLEPAWSLDDDTEGVAVDGQMYAGFQSDPETVRVAAHSPSDGSRRWQATVDRVFSLEFAASRERLFATGKRDEDRSDRGGSIHAFDRSDGTHEWSFTGERHWFGNPAVGDGLAFCTATARDESGLGSALYAFRADAGTAEWTVDLGTSHVFGVAVVDDTVLVSQNGIRGFDAATGEPRPAFTESLPAPYEAAVAGDRIYVRTHMALKAYARSDFRQLWSVDRPEPSQYSRPVAADGGVLVARPAGVTAFDATTGEERWGFETQGRALAPSVESGVVWTSDSLGVVYALRLADGERLFRSDAPADKGQRLVSPAGDTLVVSDWESVSGYGIRSD